MLLEKTERIFLLWLKDIVGTRKVCDFVYHNSLNLSIVFFLFIIFNLVLFIW
jgi:hypothetical protein